MLPALAISGSNCLGDAAFACALALPDGAVAGAFSGPRGDLATTAQQLCAQHGVPPAALRTLVVDVGPGSYTGLRVAVTFARFVHAFSDAALRAVTSFELLAAAAVADGAHASALRPVLDARRGRLHTARLVVQDGALAFTEPAAAIAAAELTDRIAPGELLLAPPARHALLAPLAQRRGAELQVPRCDVALALSPRVAPRAVAVAELEPLYLMGSYAE